MKTATSESGNGSPPGFEAAATLRQRACAAGMDPAYWYPVAWDRALKKGEVQEVRFWKTTVALYRGDDGQVHAVENRCAHRQLKLSNGWVDGCRIKCVYHGWTYGPDGKLEHIPHELFGKGFPHVQLRSYPVQVRYGLVWVFFGDPALMASRPLPEVPEAEGDEPWVIAPVDFVWKCHPTMIVNNVMDSTHVGTLHSRRFKTRSLVYGRVTRCEAEGDQVIVRHDISLDPRGMLRVLNDRLDVAFQDACYAYPHLWVSVGDVFKLWNFVLPIDETTTRIFMLPLAKRTRIPFTSWSMPRALDRVLVPILTEIFVKPLFDEDGWSTALEQEGYGDHFARPSVDPHPAPRLCYDLTVRKWEEHLAREAGKGLVRIGREPASAE
jgi:nitrite reductase/ring-hydroxylating ferredoxin subunit